MRLRLSADAPAASVSVKLCDVFADGTSALITRGSLDLAFRGGVHAPAEPAALVPGQEYDVDVVLDACAYQLAPGHTLRLAVAGADWPNTVAPPAPVTLTVHAGVLSLPLRRGAEAQPAFGPGAPASGEDPGSVDWTITRDVLRRTTTCAVRHGSDYDVPHDGHATEQYAGSVSVSSGTFDQRAEADCTFALTWPGIDIAVHSTMQVEVTGNGYDVVVAAAATQDGATFWTRTWTEHLPR